MQCPNCSRDQSPSSTECSYCGLTLAKWRPPHLQTDPLPQDDSSSTWLRLIATLTGIGIIAFVTTRVLRPPHPRVPPGYLVPTAEEQKQLAKLTDRFETLTHSDAFVVGCGGPSRDQHCRVEDALTSLDQELIFQLDCGIRITVRSFYTRWVTQDSSLLEQSASADSGRNYNVPAAYQWSGTRIEDVQGQRTLAFLNTLYLDDDSIFRNENAGSSGRIENERIYYHELLHAQLLIDAIKFDSSWRQALCANPLNIDTRPADEDHLRIPYLENYFVQALNRRDAAGTLNW